MEIILREDVQHLGKAGEVVKVKDGYARNYLLPRGSRTRRPRPIRSGSLTRPTASPSSAPREGRRRGGGGRLGRRQLTFASRSDEEDKLFGSVTASDIQRKLESSVCT